MDGGPVVVPPQKRKSQAIAWLFAVSGGPPTGITYEFYLYVFK